MLLARLVGHLDVINAAKQLLRQIQNLLFFFIDVVRGQQGCWLVLDIADVVLQVLHVGLFNQDDLAVLDVAINRDLLVALDEIHEIPRVVLVEKHDELVHAHGLELGQAVESFWVRRDVLKRILAQLETVV